MNYAQLSYSITTKQLSWIGLNGLSVHASVNNPVGLSTYTGVDAEIGFGGEEPATDNNQTPRSRQYTFTIDVRF
jgi:hypothetical protein